jgi:uncharacterized alkaline shock family protein YloU
MKEKVFNNIIFVLLIILLLILSLKCFLVSFSIIKAEYLISLVNENLHLIYSSLIHQIVLALIGLAILVFALYLIWLKQKMIQQLPYVKVITDSGEIKISTLSLEQIILSILNDIEGVRKIKPEIQVQKGGDIKTILQLVIAKDCHIPDTANLIQRKLKEELPKISGVEIKEVKINVEKIDYE